MLLWHEKYVFQVNEVSFQLRLHEWDSSHIMVWLLCCSAPLHTADFTAVQLLVITGCSTLPLLLQL